jgi:hypothetical protein
MWSRCVSRALGREVETVWPGINEVQVTAARTGQYAGIDPAKLGPDVTRTFAGRAKTEGGWRDVQVEVTYLRISAHRDHPFRLIMTARFGRT